jgi:uncharacterized protein YciI
MLKARDNYVSENLFDFYTYQKTMKILHLATFSTLVFACVASGTYGQGAPKTPNREYDAALAKKLGADQRGMKNYVLVVLNKGPKYDVVKGDERTEIFKGHFANIGRLAKEGSLLVAGPFDDPGSDWAGLFVFNVDSVEAAQKLTETDPTIKRRRFHR